MSPFDDMLAERKSVTSCREYFSALTDTLTQRLDLFKKERTRLLTTGFAASDLPIEISAMGSEEIAGIGSKAIRFQSSLTLVRLFANQPPGWLCGEISFFHPFASEKQRFAMSFFRNDGVYLPDNCIGIFTLDSHFNLTESLYSLLVGPCVTTTDVLPQKQESNLLW